MTNTEKMYLKIEYAFFYFPVFVVNVYTAHGHMYL